MSLKPGTILNERYLIDTILGEGGMGAVYRAQDMFRGKQLVAVKEFRLKHLPSEEEISLYNRAKQPSDIITREKSLAQFRLEAQLLAGLDHPNLPKVTDYFPSGKDYYIVMTLIVGKDASTLLSSMNGKPLPERAVYVWMRQVMDALIYCHSKGVIHRDIKPANIILTVSGTVYLVDFGIAKIDSPTKATSIGARVVTPGFSPPEQYSLGRTDARSDIYSLGATLYAMLTGHQPIESINRYMGMTMLEPHELVPDITPALEEIILKAIDLQPDERFQSVVEMKQEFSSVFGGTFMPQVSPATAEPVQKEAQTQTKVVVEQPSNEPSPSEPQGSSVKEENLPERQVVPPRPVPPAGAVIAQSVQKSSEKIEPVRKKPRNFLRSLFSGDKEESVPSVSRIPGERKRKQEIELGESIQRIYWADQGDLLAIVTKSSLSLYDRENIRTLWRDDVEWDNPCKVAFSTDKTMLAAGVGSRVQVWNLMTGENLREFTLDAEYPILDLTILENGTLLVSGANPHENRFKIWEMQSLREFFSVRENAAHPVNALFSPNGRLIAAAWMGYSAAGTPEGVVRLYDLISFREFFQAPVRADIIPAMSFATGETMLGIGSSQALNMRNLRVFKPPSSLEVFGKDHATRVIDITFDLDVDLVATIGDDGSVKIWDLNDRSEVLLDQLNGIKNASCISFSPKERLAAVGSVDGVIRLLPYQKARVSKGV